MATVRTDVFVHLAGGPVAAGLLTMTDEPRNRFATFAYGRRYLARPDRVPVDRVALPLHDPGTERTFRTEEGFAVFASGDSRVGALAFRPTPERPKRIMPWAIVMRQANTLPSKNWPKLPSARRMSIGSTRSCGGC